VPVNSIKVLHIGGTASAAPRRSPPAPGICGTAMRTGRPKVDGSRRHPLVPDRLINGLGLPLEVSQAELRRGARTQSRCGLPSFGFPAKGPALPTR